MAMPGLPRAPAARSDPKGLTLPAHQIGATKADLTLGVSYRKAYYSCWNNLSTLLECTLECERWMSAEPETSSM